MGNLIDISTPIHAAMNRWPDDPPVEVLRLRRIEDGDDYNLTTISMSAHTGTHVDAPLHFLQDGASLDLMAIDALIGPVLVVAGNDLPAEPAERLLFRCGSEIRASTARQIAARGVRVVGIDSLSIGDAETHKALLSAGVWIIECLDLSAAEPGWYELICLPLRLQGAEGAPARAVLRALI